MKEQERKIKATQIFEEMQTLMEHLWSRWQDEREYEDFGDYVDKMKDAVVKFDCFFIKAQKKPFGFTYKLSDAIYQIEISKTTYRYLRIA